MIGGSKATPRSPRAQSIVPLLSNYTAKTTPASTEGDEQNGLCPGFKETEKTA
jgi:hypothetical protein